MSRLNPLRSRLDSVDVSAENWSPIARPHQYGGLRNGNNMADSLHAKFAKIDADWNMRNGRAPQDDGRDFSSMANPLQSAFGATQPGQAATAGGGGAGTAPVAQAGGGGALPAPASRQGSYTTGAGKTDLSSTAPPSTAGTNTGMTAGSGNAFRGLNPQGQAYRASDVVAPSAPTIGGQSPGFSSALHAASGNGNYADGAGYSRSGTMSQDNITGDSGKPLQGDAPLVPNSGMTRPPTLTGDVGLNMQHWRNPTAEQNTVVQRYTDGSTNTRYVGDPAPMTDKQGNQLPADTPRPTTFSDIADKVSNAVKPAGLKKGTARVPGKGNSDTVHAMLTPGEAVLNKGAAQAMGRAKIAALNAKHGTPKKTGLRGGVMHAGGGLTAVQAQVRQSDNEVKPFGAPYPVYTPPPGAAPLPQSMAPQVIPQPAQQGMQILQPAPVAQATGSKLDAFTTGLTQGVKNAGNAAIDWISDPNRTAATAYANNTAGLTQDDRAAAREFEARRAAQAAKPGVDYAKTLDFAANAANLKAAKAAPAPAPAAELPYQTTKAPEADVAAGKAQAAKRALATGQREYLAGINGSVDNSFYGAGRQVQQHGKATGVQDLGHGIGAVKHADGSKMYTNVGLGKAIGSKATVGGDGWEKTPEYAAAQQRRLAWAINSGDKGLAATLMMDPALKPPPSLEERRFQHEVNKDLDTRRRNAGTDARAETEAEAKLRVEGNKLDEDMFTTEVDGKKVVNWGKVNGIRQFREDMKGMEKELAAMGHEINDQTVRNLYKQEQLKQDVDNDGMFSRDKPRTNSPLGQTSSYGDTAITGTKNGVVNYNGRRNYTGSMQDHPDYDPVTFDLSMELQPVFAQIQAARKAREKAAEEAKQGK